MTQRNILESLDENYYLSYNIMMSKTRTRNTNYLSSLGRKAKGESTTAKVDKIIELYRQSKISQVQTAENIINKLVSSKTDKEQKSAFKQYEKIVDKYQANEPLNKRLTDKKEMRKKKQFYVSGKIHLMKTSIKTNKKVYQFLIILNFTHIKNLLNVVNRCIKCF